MRLKLGKAPARRDPRTLQAARYTILPKRPLSALYGVTMEWPMYANDQYGDCTIAAKWHMVQAWSHGYKTTSARVVAEYLRLTGGPDEGLVMLDVLNDWRKANDHRITAYAQVRIDEEHISDATYLFGGVYLGVALPDYLNQRMSRGHWEWSLPTANDTGSQTPGSWGGHAVNIVGYSTRGVQIVTWGRRISCSWSFLVEYSDEAYAAISPYWFEKTGKDRHGFNQAQLAADLAAIQHQGAVMPENNLNDEANRIAKDAVNAVEAFAQSTIKLPADVARLALDALRAAVKRAEEIVQTTTRGKE